MPRVAICADDFGMSTGVNHAVSELAWQGRLSATSVLVDGPGFGEGAATLRRLRQAGQVDIGLHLNLTESFGLSHPRWPLAKLLVLSYAGALPAPVLATEVRRQFDAFEQALGFAPDHVDGHQHVHQLPCVRAALFAALEAGPRAGRPWVRLSRGPWPGFAVGGGGPLEKLKPLAIGLLGARALQRGLRARGIASNHRLLGIYSDSWSQQGYAARLARWARAAVDTDLFMCHPARSAKLATDASGTGREAEFGVLGGPALPAIFDEHGITVHRMSHLLAPDTMPG